MSGWRSHGQQIGSALRGLRERGQSETIGVALLTGVVVILAGLVGAFMFANLGADDEEQLLADIDADVEAAGITLAQQSGDTFDAGSIEVVLTGDAERNLQLSEDFNATKGGDDELAPGDIWESNNSTEILGEGRLLVIHEPTNDALLDQPYAVAENGVDP